MCLTLRPHGLQHTRLPCSSLSLGICSNSCPLSRWCQPTVSSSVIPSIKKYLIAKNANHFMSLQRIIAVTLKITDHRYQSKYHNEKVWNITQITKMWLRDTSWANTVGKLMPINCLSAGLPQTFNRRKTRVCKELSEPKSHKARSACYSTDFRRRIGKTTWKKCWAQWRSDIERVFNKVKKKNDQGKMVISVLTQCFSLPASNLLLVLPLTETNQPPESIGMQSCGLGRSAT